MPAQNKCQPIYNNNFFREGLGVTGPSPPSMTWLSKTCTCKCAECGCLGPFKYPVEKDFASWSCVAAIKVTEIQLQYTIVPFHVDNINLIDIAAFYLLTSENINFRTAIECINLSLEVWFGKHLEEVCQQSSQSCRCAMFKRMSLWSWGALED